MAISNYIFLRGLDRLGRFSNILFKGGNFFDSQKFPLLYKMVENLIFFLLELTAFQKGRKTIWELLFLKVVHFPLIWKWLEQLSPPWPQWLSRMRVWWWSGGYGFDPCRVREHSFVEIDHKIFSTVIIFLLVIQEGHLSVSGKRMWTNTS